MTRITSEMVHAAYEAAKGVREDRISRKAARETLLSKNGMNMNSSDDYIHNYNCMMEGRLFPRTNNAMATDIYLSRIYEDGGQAKLRDALQAVQLHIDYRENISDSSLPSQREIYDRYCKLGRIQTVEVYPDEVDDEDEKLLDGASKRVFVNIYERSPIARLRCIDHYGCACSVCDFDFSRTYGELGKGFIHVHHLLELASIRKEYTVDPIRDLRPVCPNCHAMLHKKKPAFTIEELRMVLTKSPKT